MFNKMKSLSIPTRYISHMYQSLIELMSLYISDTWEQM